MTGKERKEATLAGCDICDMCNPSAKRRPEKNWVAWRAVERDSIGCFSFVEPVVRAVSTSFGTVRAARMLSVASSTRDAVVVAVG